MKRGRFKVLLVESDPQVVDIVGHGLSRRFGAQVTCVRTGQDCLDVEILEPHDAVIAEMKLPDMDGLDLAEQLRELSSRPVILIGERSTPERMVQAMRLGVRDYLVKPFPVGSLMDVVQDAVHSYHLNVQGQVRHQRLRDCFRKAVRQRRDLKRRVEVICQDLVHAHRGLVDRVLHYQNAKTPEN